MKKYEDFLTEDFIKDESFQKWVKSSGDENTNKFWEAFLERFPQKKDSIEEARDFILMLNFKDTSVSENEVNLLKNKIEGAISYPVMFPYEKEKNPSKRPDSITTTIAAVLALTIIAAAVIFFTKGTIINAGSSAVAEKAALEEHVSEKGKRSMIVLEDGTRVWLNVASKISYNKNFTNQPLREVFLDGEAFFEVAKDPQKPFIVRTSSISVRVTGTSFNVRSYEKDEFVETTLIEGKVIIEMENKDKKGQTVPPIEAALLPNQQARYIKKINKIELENRVIAENYSDWRTGKLYFEERPIMEVIGMLERWYNIDIRLETPPEMGCHFSAKLDNMPLEEVLELFKMSDGINYTISEDKVFISGKLCNELKSGDDTTM